MLPTTKRVTKCSNRKLHLPLVALVLTCGGLLALVKSLIANNQEMHPKDKEQKSTDAHEDMVKPGPTAQHHPPTAHPEVNTTNKWYQTVNVWLLVVQTLIFGIMVWTNCIYVGHWKQYTRAADAADKQAIAIQDQLREMRATRILDERAWVTETEIQTPTLSDKHDLGIFTIVYRNTGKTPAINAQFVTGSAMTIEQIPTKDLIPTPPANAAMIAPGGVSYSQTPKIPITVMQNVLKGTPFYLYGTVWYDDIFRGHHWSQFACRVESNPVTQTLVQTETLAIHNSCDETGQNNQNPN